MKFSITFILLALCSYSVFAQEMIEVTVRGMSDGVKNSKQQDRDEAILDAKLKAIERAGVSIEAVTTMEDFKLKKDWVESKAQAVILPGFQILDIGYGADGLYHVVLTGKVSHEGETVGDTEGDRKFRMAKLLLEEDKPKALEIMEDVVDNYGDCSSADDALYYLIIESSYNTNLMKERLIKLKVYYPDSQYISQAEKYVEKEEERKFIESLGFKFVNIPAGSFVMGSNYGNINEKPIHRVILKPFQMQTTEVTQAQWISIMGNNPSYFNGVNLPVEQVSWDDIQEFIQKLKSLDSGKGYRLPTEAEWEYACRAGTSTEYYSGISISDVKRVSWYYGNSGGKTHQVETKAPNAWGLYDIHGNVWEWCEDYYHKSYNGAPNDGSAWVSPSVKYRILRGGSWKNEPRFCRSACRHWHASDYRSNVIGFRLVRNP